MENCLQEQSELCLGDEGNKLCHHYIISMVHTLTDHGSLPTGV